MFLAGWRDQQIETLNKLERVINQAEKFVKNYISEIINKIRITRKTAENLNISAIVNKSQG